MTKHEAHAFIDNGNVTWDDLRDLIRQARRVGMSQVNPSLTKSQCLDILSAGIKSRSGAVDHTSALQRLTATNILREAVQ
jgi:hypothetical protein